MSTKRTADGVALPRDCRLIQVPRDVLRLMLNERDWLDPMERALLAHCCKFLCALIRELPPRLSLRTLMSHIEHELELDRVKLVRWWIHLAPGGADAVLGVCVQRGYWETLAYLVENQMVDPNGLCEMAVKRNQVQLLARLRSMGVPWDYTRCIELATGHARTYGPHTGTYTRHILRWILSNPEPPPSDGWLSTTSTCLRNEWA